MFKRPTGPGFYWVENDQEKFVAEVSTHYTLPRTLPDPELIATVTGDSEEYTFDDFEIDFNIIRWLGKVEPPQKLS